MNWASRTVVANEFCRVIDCPFLGSAQRTLAALPRKRCYRRNLSRAGLQTSCAALNTETRNSKKESESYDLRDEDQKMTFDDVILRIDSAVSASEIDRAILAATDFVQAGAGNDDELKRLFSAIVRQIESVNDREEALNCLSHCAGALGSLRAIDLSKLVCLIEECSTGEVLHVVEILSHSERPEYLVALQRLAEDRNRVIAEDAFQAMEMIRTRTLR